MPTGNRQFDDFDAVNNGTSAEDDAVWDLLSIYIDGEASPEEALSVKMMLASDPAYARAFAAMQNSSVILRQVPAVEPPASLRMSILEATSRRRSIGTRLAAAWGELRSRMTLPDFARYSLPIGAVAAALLIAVSLPHRQAAAPAAIAPDGARLAAAHPIAPIVPEMNVTPDSGHETAVVPPVRSASPAETLRAIGAAASRVHLDRRPNALAVRVGPGSRTLNVAVARTPAPVHHSAALLAHTGSSDESDTTEAAASIPYARQPERAPRPSASVAAANEDLGPSVEPSEASVPTRVPDAAPTRPAVADVADTASTSKTSASRPIIHYVSLPPETRQLLSSAAIRREIAARTDNYDRSVVESIQRREVTVSVVRGSF